MFSPKQKKTITTVIVVILIALMVLTMVLPPLLSRMSNEKRKNPSFRLPRTKG